MLHQKYNVAFYSNVKFLITPQFIEYENQIFHDEQVLLIMLFSVCRLQIEQYKYNIFVCKLLKQLMIHYMNVDENTVTLKMKLLYVTVNI